MGARSIAVDIVVNTALAAPPVRKWHDSRKKRRGYDASKDTVAYARGVFDKHYGRLKSVREISGNVLEIGPGGNVATAMLFVEAGADRAVCIDVFPWVEGQSHLYHSLVSDPRPLLDRIEYRCPEEIETTPLPDGSFDLIYSHAVLEHVRDPVATIHSIARLLKRGGATSHQIDLRDHRDFDKPLAFLRYSDLVWTAATSRRSIVEPMAFDPVDRRIRGSRACDSRCDDHSGVATRFRGVSSHAPPVPAASDKPRNDWLAANSGQNLL